MYMIKTFALFMLILWCTKTQNAFKEKQTNKKTNKTKQKNKPKQNKTKAKNQIKQTHKQN